MPTLQPDAPEEAVVLEQADGGDDFIAATCAEYYRLLHRHKKRVLGETGDEELQRSEALLRILERLAPKRYVDGIKQNLVYPLSDADLVGYFEDFSEPETKLEIVTECDALLARHGQKSL